MRQKKEGKNRSPIISKMRFKKEKEKKNLTLHLQIVASGQKKTKIMSHLNSSDVKQFQFLNEQKAGAGLLSPMRMQLFDLEANANSKNFTHL